MWEAIFQLPQGTSESLRSHPSWWDCSWAKNGFASSHVHVMRWCNKPQKAMCYKDLNRQGKQQPWQKNVGYRGGSTGGQDGVATPWSFLLALENIILNPNSWALRRKRLSAMFSPRWLTTEAKSTGKQLASVQTANLLYLPMVLKMLFNNWILFIINVVTNTYKNYLDFTTVVKLYEASFFRAFDILDSQWLDTGVFGISG